MGLRLLFRNNGQQKLAAGIILVAIGVFSTINGIAQKNNIDSMKRWPVIRADVTEVIEVYKDGSSARPGNMLDIDNYTFKVEYTVDDNTYLKVFSSERSSELTYPDEAYEIIYNPKDPDEAYLASDPPENKNYYWIGMIAGVIGIILLYFAFERKEKKKNKKAKKK